MKKVPIFYTLQPYLKLMRLHKPIGIFLLLWPTLWALWLAGHGSPPLGLVCIFVAGVILMRSAGCVINDVADRHWDGEVERTRRRPLVTGDVSTKAALLLFFILLFLAGTLLLFLNTLTFFLAILAAILTVFYPFMKRWTHLPQVGLGIAFAWGVLMAFSAEQQTIPLTAGVLFLAAVIWPVIYDTQYAMTDREDDKKIGIKSTAILFGKHDKKIIGLLQMLFLILLCFVGIFFRLHPLYYVSLLIAALFFLYQQKLIRDRDPKKCFRAFLNNHWVGAIIFLGIIT